MEIHANRDCMGLDPILVAVIPDRFTCPHCGGCGNLYFEDGTMEDCGVCCENGYVDQEEYDEYFKEE